MRIRFSAVATLCVAACGTAAPPPPTSSPPQNSVLLVTNNTPHPLSVVFWDGAPRVGIPCDETRASPDLAPNPPWNVAITDGPGGRILFRGVVLPGLRQRLIYVGTAAVSVLPEEA